MSAKVDVCTLLVAVFSAVLLVVPGPIPGVACDARASGPFVEASTILPPERTERSACRRSSAPAAADLQLATARQLAGAVPGRLRR